MNGKLCYALLSVSIALVLPESVSAETGMCMVVCSNSRFGQPGDIKRIDLVNDKVAKTSANIAYGSSPRFSPDGTEFAYISGTTVKICELDGTVKKQFTVAASDGNISYTSKGIYQASGGKIHLYDMNGNETWSRGFSNLTRSNAYVSQNGKLASGVENIGNWRVVIYNLENGKTIPIMDEQGCSACPSPNGTMTTQNGGGPRSQCHLFMRIRNADGSIKKTLHIDAVTGLSKSQNWCWNTQAWSGNSNDWIIIPVGQDDGSGGCSQLERNCSPWIHNISDGQTIQLANRTSDFWMPVDYYSGFVYDPNTPSLRLSPSAIEFLADSGDANPAKKTVTASTISGSLESVSVTGAPSWLTVSPSATSGTEITLSNSVDIGGLATGQKTAKVTVKTANAGEKSYSVRLVIKSKPALTAIAVTPALAAVEPNASVQFSAEALDQYGAPFEPKPAITWSVSGGATIKSSTGLLTAGTIKGGPYTVTAQGGGISGTAHIVVAGTPDVHLKVNCGENQFSVSGWEQDDAYLNNDPPDHTWANPVATSGVENAAPQGVYKSVVHMNHAYNFADILDGVYTLRLHLADEYGNRAMTYIAEGDTVLKSFDIVAVAGKNKALVKDLPVLVTDGNGMQLGCVGTESDVFECGLEIIGFSVQPPPLRLVSPNGGEGYAVGQSLTVRWESANSDAYYVIQLSVDGGIAWHNITEESGVTGGSYEWKIPNEIEGNSTTSADCKIKLYDYVKQTITDMSDATFRIGVGQFTIHPPSVSSRRDLVFRADSHGSLNLTLGRDAPYSVQLVRPNGSVWKACSGRGPARHVFKAASLPSGLYLLRARVDAKEYRHRITVMK